MTTYEVTSDGGDHRLVASWADLPEPGRYEVATFEDQKLASVARSVLNVASRYRWHRWLQLVGQGIYSDEQAGPDSTIAAGPPRAQGSSRSPLSSGRLPRLTTGVLLGDSPISGALQALIESLLDGEAAAPELAIADPAGFADRLPLGNLRPLLWRDWCGHLSAAEHDALAAELDTDLPDMASAPTGRARQAAWYLSAELLIDEDHSALVRSGNSKDSDRRAKAFQKSLVQLFSELIGLKAESTAVEWDPDNEELLRVYSPSTVVGFWLDPECWYHGWPEPNPPEGEPATWQHAGTLPADTTVGIMAAFIVEQLGKGTWPFGGSAPSAKRSLFGGFRPRLG